MTLDSFAVTSTPPAEAAQSFASPFEMPLRIPTNEVLCALSVVNDGQTMREMNACAESGCVALMIDC